MGVLESKRFFAIATHLEGVYYSQRLIGHALKIACIDLCQSGVGLDCKGWGTPDRKATRLTLGAVSAGGRVKQ